MPGGLTHRIHPRPSWRYLPWRRQIWRRPSWTAALLVVILYLGGYSLWLWTGPASDPERLWVGNFARFLPILAAAGLARIAWRAPAGPRLPRAWHFFSVGMLLWSIGGLVWIFHELVLRQESPPVSLADLFTLAGYPALLWGLVLYVPGRLRRFGWLRLALDMGVSTVALTGLAGLFFIGPVLASAASVSPQTPPFEQRFWTLVYPLGDLVLLGIALNVFLAGDPDTEAVESSNPEERSNRFSLWLIGASLASFALSHVAAGYLLLQRAEITGSPATLGLVLGTCLFCLAAVAHSGRAGWPAQPPRQGRSLLPRIQLILPFASTVVLAWYAVANWQMRGDVDLVSTGIVALCVAMLILRQGVAAGEEELRQYAMLVYSAADPAFICDVKGRLKLANPAMAALTGVTLEGLAGQSLAGFIACPEYPGASMEACGFWEVYPAKLAEGWTGEVGIRREGGHTLPVHLSLSPFSAPGARQVWLAGTVHDLTQQKIQQADLQMAYDQVAAAHQALEALNENLERKVDEKMHSLSQAYAQLEQQNQTLQQLDRLKSDFVSLVSHELRAPLTNISGGIELVLSGPLDDSLRQPLSLVQSEIHRLSTFVETILDVSALDAGHLPLYLAPVSLADAVAVVRWQVARQPGGERVAWNVPHNLPLIMADERILSSIFFHLVDNALKYAPQGPVWVLAETQGERVRVTVEDEGPGIPPEAMPLLFEKFQRLEAADSQTVYGHGLGLYMVRKLLRAMHGDIQASCRGRHDGEGAPVTGAPVTGACFTFWLPVYQDGEPWTTGFC